jgi:hypothetical protein
LRLIGRAGFPVCSKSFQGQQSGPYVLQAAQSPGELDAGPGTLKLASRELP